MSPIRFSHLKHLSRSPAHYRHALTSRVDNAAMRMGRLVHWNVLGGMPDDEDGRVVVYDGERRGNSWKEFAAANIGCEIVTATEWAKSLPIADAVRANPIAARLLENAETERHVRWKIGARECSSRPDAYVNGAHLWDLKTTTNCRPDELMRQAFKMQYFAQLAFYTDALAYHGIAVPKRYIVAVETVAPHAVTVLELTDGLIELGRRTYRGWLEQLQVCQDSDFWPEYAQHAVPWGVPEWMEVGEDDEDDEEEAAA
jgi:hypothetical protein